MKKKKILTEVFILFFVAAVFMAVYVVIEMGNDLLAVLGGAAILLIAAYLLVDYLLESKTDNSEKPAEDQEEVQKAIYSVLKRGNSENAELLRGLDARIAELTLAMNRLAEAGEGQSAAQKELLKANNHVVDAVKDMRQDYQTGVKNLIKFEKENARQIAETAHNNTEMVIVELGAQFAKVLQSLQDQKEQIAFIGLSSSVSTPFKAPADDFETDGDDILPVLEDATMPAADGNEEEAFADENFDAEAAIKAYMAEQGFEVIDDEEMMEEEPAPAVEETEEKNSYGRSMTDEEVAETLQNMASGDPNRALTPEEIAAMFAAVQ